MPIATPEVYAEIPLAKAREMAHRVELADLRQGKLHAQRNPREEGFHRSRVGLREVAARSAGARAFKYRRFVHDGFKRRTGHRFLLCSDNTA